MRFHDLWTSSQGAPTWIMWQPKSIHFRYDISFVLLPTIYLQTDMKSRHHSFEFWNQIVAIFFLFPFSRPIKWAKFQNVIKCSIHLLARGTKFQITEYQDGKFYQIENYLLKSDKSDRKSDLFWGHFSITGLENFKILFF